MKAHLPETQESRINIFNTITYSRVRVQKNCNIVRVHRLNYNTKVMSK